MTTSSLAVFAAAWAGDQVSSPETSCTLLLGDKEENTSSSSWPGHRLFPRDVQVLAAELSPCRGCPAFAHAEGGGQSSQQGHPPAKHSTHLKGAWAQRGLREFLSSVWFVESVVCSGSHALQGLAQPHLEPTSALAHTASTDERFPRSPSTVQGTAPGACSEPGYGQLQLMVSNSCFGRDSE